ELAGLRELQNLILGLFTQTRPAGRRDPYVAFVVDVDRVFVFRPLVSGAFAAPALYVVTGAVELHDGRRFAAGVPPRLLSDPVGVERPRTLDDPDVIVRIDVEARHLSENPLLRKLWPERIDLVRRRLRLCARNSLEGALSRSEHG